MMKVAILDDWFDTLRGLPCFAKLGGHEVVIWNDHVEDDRVLAERLAETEALVLIRERTPLRNSLIERLPNLRLVSQRGAYPHIDVAACTRRGIAVCSNQSADQPNQSAAELTWALILAAYRDLPRQCASLRAGRWQAGVGKTLRGKTLGIFGYGRIGKLVAQYGRAFGMTVLIWSSESSRKRAAADGWLIAESKEAFLAASDVVSLHLRLGPSTQTRPSIMAASSRQIARPRPVPSKARVVEASTCEKLSNSRSRLSASMPMPVSDTLRWTPSTPPN